MKNQKRYTDIMKTESKAGIATCNQTGIATCIPKDETIVLASSSPRRIEMFENHGMKPIIIKPQCDENLPENIGMEDAVMLLSLRKALEVERVLQEAAGTSGVPGDLFDKHPLIIAADTIVYHDKIIGKPTDRADAEAILMDLCADVHYVVTGVSILRAGCTQRRTFAEISEVHFTDYTREELQGYLDTDEPYDKAGAYAIQGTFEKYIDRVVGDYNNIVGFPWDRFIAELDRFYKLQVVKTVSK